MKVVIASGIYEPDMGGPATYVKFLAKSLADLGWNVSVVTWSSVKKYHGDYIANYKVYRVVQKGKLGLLFYMWRLFLASNKADIIFAQGSLHEGLPAHFVSKILRKKLVVRVPGDQAWESARNAGYTADSIDLFQKRNYSFKIKIKKLIQKHVARSANLVITPSYYLRSVVSGWGVKSSRIEVVKNIAVSVPSISNDKLLVKAPYILTSGRFVSWKNFDIIIKAFRLIKSNVRLVLIGSGPKFLELKRLAADDKRINFLEPLDKKLFYSYLKNAKIFVLASDYEGMSHVLLEAMQIGTPVIATDITPNREIIDNGKNGILVQIKNVNDLHRAMENLLRNAKLGNKLKNNALDYIKSHKETYLIKQMDLILKRLLK